MDRKSGSDLWGRHLISALYLLLNGAPIGKSRRPNFEQFPQKIQQVFVQKVKSQLFSAYLLQFTQGRTETF